MTREQLTTVIVWTILLAGMALACLLVTGVAEAGYPNGYAWNGKVFNAKDGYWYDSTGQAFSVYEKWNKYYFKRAYPVVSKTTTEINVNSGNYTALAEQGSSQAGYVAQQTYPQPLSMAVLAQSYTPANLNVLAQQQYDFGRLAFGIGQQVTEQHAAITTQAIGVQGGVHGAVAKDALLSRVDQLLARLDQMTEPANFTIQVQQTSSAKASSVPPGMKSAVALLRSPACAKCHAGDGEAREFFDLEQADWNETTWLRVLRAVTREEKRMPLEGDKLDPVQLGAIAEALGAAE